MASDVFFKVSTVVLAIMYRKYGDVISGMQEV